MTLMVAISIILSLIDKSWPAANEFCLQEKLRCNRLKKGIIMVINCGFNYSNYVNLGFK